MIHDSFERSILDRRIDLSIDPYPSPRLPTQFPHRFLRFALFHADAAKIVLDTANASVALEDQVLAREHSQFTASVDSVERDLHVRRDTSPTSIDQSMNSSHSRHIIHPWVFFVPSSCDVIPTRVSRFRDIADPRSC